MARRSDFADEFPDTEVTGTDVSPIQPVWLPPNVRFEIDDATEEPWSRGCGRRVTLTLSTCATC